MLLNSETSFSTTPAAVPVIPAQRETGGKTCVILQPSYIPWRGYFDQILKADVFVFYDDVQYDKHGWRNRNRIKTPKGPQWLTIPVAAKGNITQSRNIKDIPIVYDKDWVNLHLENLKNNYGRTPFFREYMELLLPFYKNRYELLAEFTIDTTIALAGKLGVPPERFVRSSELGIAADRNQRLIDILKHLNCEHYITGPSAQDYIERQLYADAGIKLSFIKYDYPEYPQLYPPFEPQVTILDLLFSVGDDAPKYMTGSLTS